jgi:hypothetical protein
MRVLPIALLSLISLATALPNLSPPPPWRRLTNSLISKIWKLPGEQQRIIGTSPAGNAGTTQANRRVSARYGRDIVLRFNLTSAAEASALSEAANDLFLDIWAFSENWADIRIAKDVVCLRNINRQQCHPRAMLIAPSGAVVARPTSTESAICSSTAYSRVCPNFVDHFNLAIRA